MKEVPSDSAVHVPGRRLQRILFALDVSAAELLYAKDHAYDCVLGHHPRGLAIATFYRVLERQSSLLEELGAPKEEAERATARLRRSAFLNALAPGRALRPTGRILFGWPSDCANPS
ncbi:MAG: hypothetical protein WCP58_03520 [bacterium]